MSWLLSDAEREALWNDEPFKPAAWECPQHKCERYEKALRGILACAAAGPGVLMLQAVAARALGDHALEADLMHRLKALQNLPPT
jgi:hypothetical protein